MLECVANATIGNPLAAVLNRVWGAVNHADAIRAIDWPSRISRDKPNRIIMADGDLINTSTGDYRTRQVKITLGHRYHVDSI